MEQESEPGGSAMAGDDEEYEPTPWHFKLLLLGLVAYLVYRGYQFVEWGVRQL